MRKLIDLFIIVMGYYLMYNVVFNEVEIYGESAVCAIGLMMSAAYLTHMYVRCGLYKIKKIVKTISEKTTNKKEEKKADNTETEKA